MNRLRRVVKKNTLQEVATYQYDSLNRRVRKETTAHATTGASHTRFLYDGWHAIEERDASNSVTKQFVYGERIDEILKMDRYISGVMSSTYYYHDDILGSVCALSDTNGHVVERVKYSPYGQPYFLDSNQQPIRDLQGNFETQSSIRNPLLFTAARYDSELSQRTSSQTTDKVGNYYLRNRYLNSNQGRFLTRDPIGIWTDDANLGGGYSYAGNDPVNLRDPLGLNCFKEDDEEEAKKKKKEKIKKLAAGAFRETSGLRPKWKDPNGPRKKENYDQKSADDLHRARKAIAQTLDNGGKISSPTPPSEEELKDPNARDAWEDCLKAAEEALDSPDPTLGKDTRHFYLRSNSELKDDVKGSKPPWANGVKPAQSYGPIRNAAGGGDVPKGDVWIDFYKGIQ